MSGRGRKLIADRLTVLLTDELKSLEAWSAEGAEAEDGTGPSATSIKARVEVVAQITRTLEKLLDLKRLETLTMKETSAEDEAEAARLRDELMRRLRAVDARRGGGAGLFEASAGVEP